MRTSWRVLQGMIQSKQSREASSCLQAVATGILRGKKSPSQSHQRTVFESLSESKQTSRGVCAVKSCRKTEGMSESLCISASCVISGLWSSVASFPWVLHNPSRSEYLCCFLSACKQDFSVTPARCCLYRYGRDESPCDLTQR